MAEPTTKKQGKTRTTERRAGGSSTGFTAEEREAMRERARELKAARGKADGERDLLAKIAEMPSHGRAAPRHRDRDGPHAGPEDLVRDAGLRQGRQGRVLLPERRQVQGAVRDVRLQRRRQPRRRHDVADVLRAEGPDRRRRGDDRCPRAARRELRLTE